MRPTLCCGSAGVYNLLNPEPANQLGDRKVENLLATKAEAVISANPGCLLQLMAGLGRRGLKAMPTFHMVELLDASIRGVTTAELLWNRDGDSEAGIDAQNPQMLPLPPDQGTNKGRDHSGGRRRRFVTSCHVNWPR